MEPLSPIVSGVFTLERMNLSEAKALASSLLAPLVWRFQKKLLRGVSSPDAPKRTDDLLLHTESSSRYPATTRRDTLESRL